MDIVDSQVHVWSPNTPEHPWADPVHAAEHRFEALGAEQLLGEMEVAGVDRAVLIPPAFEGERNELALAAARRFPDRFAVVARVPIEKATARELVESWKSTPGLLGFRVTFTREKRRWLWDGTADWFWPAAEEVGVPVMVYAPGETREVARIARLHATLRIALDHFGLAGTAGPADIARATDELERAARVSNLSVKASALPVYVSDAYPFRSLHDCIRRVVAAFGPPRVFWGSDMSRLTCSYREAVAFLTEVDGLGDNDLTWIMGRGVAEWLNWPLDG